MRKVYHEKVPLLSPNPPLNASTSMPSKANATDIAGIAGIAGIADTPTPPIPAQESKAPAQPPRSTLLRSFSTPSPALLSSTPTTDSLTEAPSTRALAYQPNYVRLNMKRHLNVKHAPRHRPKEERSVASDRERTTQQEQQASGSGPGLLEEEVFDVMAQQASTTNTTATTLTDNKGIDSHSLSDIAPLCNHGIPAVLRTVKKAGKNHGREFYCCSHEFSRSCGFFLWKDANRSDVIAMIRELPAPVAADARAGFEAFWREELENRSVGGGEWREAQLEEMKALMRMVHCPVKGAKKQCAESLLARSCALFDEVQRLRVEVQQRPGGDYGGL